MSQGRSNTVARAASITTAAAARTNVIARGNFMGLTAAAIYFPILFSNHGGCFSATMVAPYAAPLWHEKSSFDFNIFVLRTALIELIISEMTAQYVPNLWDRTLETARGFFISKRNGSVKRARTEFSYFAVIFEK
jgi:hypothetical protein